MDRTELPLSFSVHECVVYTSNGICRVESKEMRNGREYLKIRVLDSDSIILLPSDNAGAMGLRHLSTKGELEEALRTLSDRTREIPSDWKQRIQENQALLKDGTITSTCMVVNTLYRRSKAKELPSQEKKIYDAALSMLVAETASVLNKDSREAERLIFMGLENI